MLQRKGLNQTELGKRAGLQQESISRLINRTRKPNLQTIEKIALALEASPWELFVDNDSGEVGPLSKEEKTLVSNYRAIRENAQRRTAQEVTYGFADPAKRTKI